MVRYLRVAFVALALPFLSACAGGLDTLGKVGSLLTAQVSNPITNNELKAILQAEITAKRIAIKWLKQPTCAEGASWTFARPCGKYEMRVAVKKALEDSVPIRKELIRFVRENRTVDARVAYDELNRLINVMRQVNNNN